MLEEGHTCVDEASGGAFAELFGFVRQRDLHYPWDVPWWRLHSYGVRGDQLWRPGLDNKMNKVQLHTQTYIAVSTGGGGGGGVGCGGGSCLLDFPNVAFDFSFVYNQPRKHRARVGTPLWPCSPRLCHCAVINTDTGPVSRAQAPLCVYE